MRLYCKAYRLGDLWKFPGWTEAVGGRDAGMSDEDIVFVWADFSVSKTAVGTLDMLYEQPSDQWKAFCRDVLQFEVPEDLRPEYEATSSGGWGGVTQS